MNCFSIFFSWQPKSNPIQSKMTAAYKKQSISIAIKNAVWHKYCKYPSYPGITQCYTCTNIVMIPESIRKMNEISYEVKAVFIDGQARPIFGVAEYGHVVSERNGGATTEDNLIIQCKNCNTRQGSKNIERAQLNYDTEMLDCEMLTAECKRIATADNADMGEIYDICHGVCASGKACKNKPIMNRKYCGVHLRGDP